ncbi:DUF4872 domain-containing protein [Nonomuraea jiangxiensis]|nr:DUF4872 domain-containing protein [Nonomuraea jiangxiensis]
MTALLIHGDVPPYQRSSVSQQDLPQAALLMEKGGTGGALFRDFLDECIRLIDDGNLRAGHRL